MDPSEAQRSLERGTRKLKQLLELSAGKHTFLAQTHDYPDPDTIASAVGLAWVMEEVAGMTTQIGYGGIIGRAENRAMTKILSIRLKKLSAEEVGRFDLVALLDTQPVCTNHSLPNGRTPDIVFDHHFMRELTGPKPPFFDVGGGFGTTSTKVTELVRASGLTPPTNVATALFYGVKSDTLDLARVATPADVEAYLYLFELVDRRLLGEIEHPQVPLDYFRIFNLAIEQAKIYGTFIVADLGEVYTPDLNAELADRLIQIEGIKHALATGWYEDALFLSFRSRSRKFNAGKILHNIVTKNGLGGAGGHRQMAGARISVEGRGKRARQDLRRHVVQQILESFGEDARHFERIIKPKSRAKPDGESKKKRPSASKHVNSRSNGTRSANGAPKTSD